MVKKILCVCQQGSVRSVTMATILKGRGLDCLACGVLSNQSDTIKMLCDWADKILIVTSDLSEHIPEKSKSKIVDMEIGPDVWGVPMNPDLVTKTERSIYAHSASIFNG